MKKFVVLGGAGAMGRLIVWDLATFADPQDVIVIADYDEDKAGSLAASYRSPRVQAMGLDVTNRRDCAEKLAGAFVLINSVQYQMNLDAMEAALAARAHYIDLGGLFHMTRRQLKLHDRFKKQGRLAILGMGAAPGITNVLARFLADQMDSLYTLDILVGSIDKTRYSYKPALPVSYSLKTILEEFTLPPAVFSQGRFKFLKPMTMGESHIFPKPVGRQLPMHTLHSEVATLPLSFKDKGVQEVSFRIAFDPEVVDRVKFLRDFGLASEEPIKIGLSSIVPIDLASRLAVLQPKPKPIGTLNQYEILRVAAKGTVRKKKITLIADSHCSSWSQKGLNIDRSTGSPPAIAALMLASGEIQARGVLPPERIVPCEPFFKHLKKRQIEIRFTQKPGWN